MDAIAQAKAISWEPTRHRALQKRREWLLAMQHNMCSTLYDNCKACLIQLGTAAVDWTSEKPSAGGWDPID